MRGLADITRNDQDAQRAKRIDDAVKAAVAVQATKIEQQRQHINRAKARHAVNGTPFNA